MNDLGIALAWLAVQVTAVALAGLVLSALAGRRAPAAGASVASAALAAMIVLGILAICPLPGWWTWYGLAELPADVSAAGSPTAHEEEATALQPAPAMESSRGGGMQLSGLFSAIQGLRSTSAGSAARGWFPRWPTIAAGLAGIATALGVLRLFLGLWAIRQGWQRSEPVNDPALLELIEELRSALGVKRPVAVRESLDLTTAATIGWLKPMLLLPADWHSWTAQQLRVVVAHELAHVARGDFAAWLVAQLSVAVHFWHPLVRALAGRLRLHQELAADASAAPLAGGRPAYLRALAELALRADDLAHGWPAPAFLSGKQTLLRRIEMLRVMDDGQKRRVNRIGRRLTIALVLALTLTVSALRGPVRQTGAAAPAPNVKPATVAPFDLSLLVQSASQADGVFGVRPSALLNRPGTEHLRQKMNAWIGLVTGNLGTDGERIQIEDVEQVMGRVYFKGENKTGKRLLMLSLNVLRTAKDVDWPKLRDQCALKIQEHHWKGETYVSVAMTPLLSELIGGKDPAHLWAPDARTLVLDNESTIKALIEAKAGGTKPATPPFAAGWDAVSRGLFAFAIDNRGRRLLERTMTKAELKEALADPKKVDHHLTRFYQKASTLVAGFAGGDDFRFDLCATADTPARAARLASDCEGVLATAKIAAASNSEDADEVALGFLRKALDRTSVHCDGKMVSVHADVPSGLDALLLHGLKEMSREKK
jgi:beta-lactamase regulating signal transducer with metallopeptidase domain